MEHFSIDGYWKDDSSEFTDYIVRSTDDVLPEDDDNIFYYGLSERDIQTAIYNKENTGYEFVITSYKKILF